MKNKLSDEHPAPVSEPDVEHRAVQGIREEIAQRGWKESANFVISNIECVAEACAEKKLSVSDVKLFWLRTYKVLLILEALKEEGGDEEMRHLGAAVKTFGRCFRQRSDDDQDRALWSLTELMEWLDHLDRTCQLCEASCRTWRAQWIDLSADCRRPVLDCIEEIEKRIPLLRSRRLSDMPAQWDAIDRCLILNCSLAGYGDRSDAVMRFAEAIVYDRKKWAAFLEALIGSRWLRSTSPRAYLYRVTQRVYREVQPDQGLDSQGICHTEGEGGKIARRDILAQPGVSIGQYLLSEGSESGPTEVFQRRCTESSLAEFRKAAEKEPRLAEYLKALLGKEQSKRCDIWKSLGWSKKEGEAVDRQYRRLRRRLQKTGAGMEWCLIPNRTISQASQTWFRERLDGTKVPMVSVYQHKLLKGRLK
jgi:hypothetical protein